MPIRALFALALLAGCTSSGGADEDARGARGDASGHEGAGTVVPLEEGRDAWYDGFAIEADEAFRSMRLLVRVDPTAVVEVRVRGGDWTPVTWAQVEGEHRSAVLALDEAVRKVEVRSDGQPAWAQAELFAGDPVFDDDHPDGAGSPDRRARAASGMWTPASEVLDVGMQWYLPYEYADACVGTTLPGTLTLADWLVENTEATSYGTYACRSIVGGSGMSVHSEGRAIDLFVPLDGSEADNDLGDPIAAYLIEHAQELGISLVIWDQASWGAHRSGDKHESYGGTHPHHDHLHIELTTDGAWGSTPWFGDPDDFGGEPPVEGWIDMAATPSGNGYWLLHTDGTVKAFGDAAHHGDAASFDLAGRTVAIAPTPSGGGYVLAGDDGGVFAFGDAPYLGSMGGQELEAPVVDVAMRPAGDGYWLAAADGGVFAFGASVYAGGMAGEPLDGDVVGVAAEATGHGYWLVAADGGVFDFGDAWYRGSMGGVDLAAPIADMSISTDGYLLYGEDGGVFAFGDARYEGSLTGHDLAAPTMAGAATPSGGGYWMVGLDGGVFALGDAAFLGNAL